MSSSVRMSEEFEIIANPRGKSAIWMHFGLKRKKEDGEVYTGVAVCKKCKMEVKNSGGTTNLNTHLERHHKVKVDGRSASSQPTSTGHQTRLFVFSSVSQISFNMLQYVSLD